MSDTTGVIRGSGRTLDEMRAVTISTGYAPYAEGSALIKMGNTHVLCTATVEESVPPFLAESGQGWITAEYGMLPRSSPVRIPRRRSAESGRTKEIARLIGRSLRAAIDLSKLGERSILVDCDVFRADGGTRTASITGGYVAVHLAIMRLIESGILEASPIAHMVAAISAGVVDGRVMLDLEYEEDSKAAVDLNVVMTDAGDIVELQATAEDGAYSRAQLDEMLDLSSQGIHELLNLQRQALAG